MRKALLAGVVTLLLVAVAPAGAQGQSYTPEEYNAYKAIVDQKDLSQRVKLLDGFVEKYPQSTMLAPYIYPIYFQTANEAYQGRNFAATLAAMDHFLALSGPETPLRVQAIYVRTLGFHNFFNEKAPDANGVAEKERGLAKEALSLLPSLTRPESVSEGDWAKQMQTFEALFHYTVGLTALQIKDYPDAAEGFREALAHEPNNAVTNYRYGLANLQMEPPHYMDGFWALARAIALKVPGEPQVRQYLRNSVLRYQNTQCDAELDRQLNEMITLAGQSAERPAGYTIPSDADLTRARENAGAFLGDLKAGGDHAQLVWLSVCGLEFPDVMVKVIEVADDGDSTILKVYRAQIIDPANPADSAKEMEEATEPNMQVTVTEQPEAKRVAKDAFVRFTGTLSGYQPEPFLLSWNNAKVNAEDIPAEDAGTGKKATKRPAKRPSRQ